MFCYHKSVFFGDSTQVGNCVQLPKSTLMDLDFVRMMATTALELAFVASKPICRRVLGFYWDCSIIAFEPQDSRSIVVGIYVLHCVRVWLTGTRFGSGPRTFGHGRGIVVKLCAILRTFSGNSEDTLLLLFNGIMVSSKRMYQ